MLPWTYLHVIYILDKVCSVIINFSIVPTFDINSFNILVLYLTMDNTKTRRNCYLQNQLTI